jgi:hypothetical protein
MTLRFVAAAALAAVSAAALAQSSGPGGRTVTAPPQAPAKHAPVGVAKLKADSHALSPLFETPLAKRFLDVASSGALADPPTRKLLYNSKARLWRTLEEGLTMPAAVHQAFTPKDCDPNFFFETRYGSPLVYARVLEVASQHGARLEPDGTAAPALLDFGYGTIGHLMLTASMCIDSAGVDVDSLLPRLYAPEVRTGSLPCTEGGSARLRLFDGQWPMEPDITQAIRTTWPEGFDLITSKNTLKMGYIHPAREVDPKLLVHLGVDDGEFIHTVFESLKPGGIFLIYNISPRLTGEGETYKPWSDGRCPFSREALTDAGFEVLAFDETDDAAVERIFKALGYPVTDDKGAKDLFAHYTVAKRPDKK